MVPATDKFRSPSLALDWSRDYIVITWLCYDEYENNFVMAILLRGYDEQVMNSRQRIFLLWCGAASKHLVLWYQTREMLTLTTSHRLVILFLYTSLWLHPTGWWACRATRHIGYIPPLDDLISLRWSHPTGWWSYCFTFHIDYIPPVGDLITLYIIDVT